MVADANTGALVPVAVTPRTTVPRLTPVSQDAGGGALLNSSPSFSEPLSTPPSDALRRCQSRVFFVAYTVRSSFAFETMLAPICVDRWKFVREARRGGGETRFPVTCVRFEMVVAGQHERRCVLRHTSIVYILAVFFLFFYSITCIAGRYCMMSNVVTSLCFASSFWITLHIIVGFNPIFQPENYRADLCDAKASAWRDSKETFSGRDTHWVLTPLPKNPCHLSRISSPPSSRPYTLHVSVHLYMHAAAYHLSGARGVDAITLPHRVGARMQRQGPAPLCFSVQRSAINVHKHGVLEGEHRAAEGYVRENLPHVMKGTLRENPALFFCSIAAFDDQGQMDMGIPRKAPPALMV